MAKALGINIMLPAESDLMRPPLLYGIGEHNPRHIKLSGRLEQFHKDRGLVRQQMQQLQTQDAYLSGAIDDATYILQSWCDDIAVQPEQAMSFADQFVKPLSAEVPRGVSKEKPIKTIGKPMKGNGKDHSVASP